ncbi:MAG: hypothetical protein ABI142_12445 [Bryocella sp.]
MNPRNITLGQFTAAFVPFGLLFVAAMMAAETSLDLNFQRLIYSVWATMPLMTVALCLFILPKRTPARSNYWLLFWTFAFLLYMVHFYYSVMVHYHGSITEVFQQQGMRIAGSNFLDTIWWGLDVVLAWTITRDVKWVRIERGLLNAYLPLTFFVASVVIFKGFVNVLGYAMTVVVLISLAVRVRAWWIARQSPAAMEVQHG